MAGMKLEPPLIPAAQPPQRPEPSDIAAKVSAAAASLRANPHDENTHRALTGRLYVWDADSEVVNVVPDSMMGR